MFAVKERDRAVRGGVWLGVILFLAIFLASLVSGYLAGRAGLMVSGGNTLIPLLAASAVLFASLCLVLPYHYLPAFALTLYAFVPHNFYLIPVLDAITPPALVMLFWLFRRRKHVPPRKTRIDASYLLALASLLIWVAVSLLKASDVQWGILWSISFLLNIALLCIVRMDGQERASLISSWVILGALLGFYSIAESLLEYNFFYQTIINAALQHWSVFRSSATFGHPLYAATFFATAFVFCLERTLVRFSLPHIAGLALIGGGLLATVSRGSVFACAIGVILLIVMSLRPRTRVKRGLVFFSALVLGIGAWFGLAGSDLLARADTYEGRASAAQRGVVQNYVFELASRYSYLGAGPGQSEDALLRSGFGDYVIENSAFQWWLSLGLPGSILILYICFYCLRHAWLCREIGTIAAFATFTISICGYNAVDSITTIHLPFGLLLMLLGPPVAGESGHLADSKGRRPRRSSYGLPRKLVSD